MDLSCFGHNIPRFPVETWEIILSYLPRAGDLYNVSLTCRYLSLVTRNLLYKHLYIDPNHYAIHTLMLLENHPQLRQQVSKLFLLPPIMRNIHPDVQEAAEAVYPQLNLPITPAPEVGLRALLWSPLGMASNTQRSGLPVDACIRPIFNYISRFTNLHSLYITGDCVPASFLQWILPLQSLTTLELRETQIASGLQRMIPCSPLPLRHLTILKCWTKTHTAADNPVAVYLCDALLSNSPHLTSLALDSFVEGAAYNLISDLRNPPALISLNCTGVGLQDHDSVMLSRVFSSLGSLTTLNISRVPRELGPILSPQSLPQLTTITGQIRSIGVFLHGRPPRPLKSITVVDFPTSAAGGLSWECILIAFIEGLHQMNVDLQCLAFNLASWSEELFLCIYQLFPKIVELKMQFILGPGVDEHFRISFGPRFLPRLNRLEVFHVFERNIKYRKHGRLYSCPKGIVIPNTQTPLNLTDADIDEIAEAPIHLRRWEKICPALRQVAFSREIWWQRKPSEPGGWSLIDEILPELTSEPGGI